MQTDRTGQIAVIFTSVLTGNDPQGYAEAATAMETLARTQPGYAGIVSARGVDGLGITVSYWADTASALAWRDHPDHVRIRDLGRERWYARYTVDVSRIERGYRWEARRPAL